MAQIIQGDVVIEAADIPKNAKAVAPVARGVVLAEGEVTGHAHVMAPATTRQFMVGDQMFIAVDSATDLVHEEHDTATIPAGTYKVGIQREYDPFAEEARRVAD